MQKKTLDYLFPRPAMSRPSSLAESSSVFSDAEGGDLGLGLGRKPGGIVISDDERDESSAPEDDDDDDEFDDDERLFEDLFSLSARGFTSDSTALG